MLQPVSSQPALVDQVHDRLVEAIADGSLAPGERLTQESVAERLGVSRQPVSHALQVLRRRGLAVEAGRRGLVVAPFDPARLRGLYQVRGALDGLAASLAAIRAKAGQLRPAAREGLAAQVRQGAAMAARGGAVTELIRADMAFHAAIYDLSGNPALVSTAAEQWPHFLRAMGAVLADPARPAQIWREHARICDRILAGDAEAAEAAARRHALDAGEAMAAKLESLPPVA